ncbi:MAG TPA: hypothetical protein VK168_11525 [Saprospiraceae bacterium]|nr:hypothetical protein [Saprospiraceae bacterium]
MKNSVQYQRKKEIYYWLLAFHQEVSIDILHELFLLLDKYYPEYKVRTKYNGDVCSWKSFVYDKNSALKSNFNELVNKEKVHLYFDLPFFIQNDNEIELIFIENAIKIIIFNESDPEKQKLFLFDLYADLFADFVFIYEGGEQFVENQSNAAPKNRAILRNFLMSVEQLFNGEVLEYYASYSLTPDSAEKYGIREDARMAE